MEKLFGLLRRCNCLWENFPDTLFKLSEVFDRFKNSNLKLKPKLCILFCKEVSFLGHVVSNDGVKCDSNKVRTVFLFLFPYIWTVEIYSWTNSKLYFYRSLTPYYFQFLHFLRFVYHILDTSAYPWHHKP